MAKEVGLNIRITSNGQEKVISNLQDLENELQSLESTLKTLDFGSKQFEETAKNIQTLRSRIEDVDKATEGFGIEKRLQAIGAATEVVAGSFQTLSGVIGVLSDDEQTLLEVQEAEAKALNVLNIALGVRAVQEGLLESRILERLKLENLLEKSSKAYISIAKGISSSLKAIGVSAGVASTGVRVLTSALTAIGIPLLISGITTLIEKFEDFNFTLGGIKSAEQAYKDFNEELDYTNELVNARIESLESQGDALGALQEKLRVYQDEQRQRGEFEISLITQRQRARENEDKEEEERLDKLINENLVKRIRLAASIRKIESDITKFQENEDKKRSDKAKRQADKLTDIRLKALDTQLQAQRDYFKELEKLTGDQIEAENSVISALEKVIERQEDILKRRNEFAKSETEKFLDEYNELFVNIIFPLGKERRELTGSFFAFQDLLNQIIIGIQKSQPESLISTELIKNTELDFNQIVELYNNFITDPDLKIELEELIGIDFTEKQTEGLLKFFNRLVRFSGELAKDEYKDVLGNVLGDDTELGRKSKLLQNIINLISSSTIELKDNIAFSADFDKLLTKQIEDLFNLRLKDVEGSKVQQKQAEIYNQKVLEIRDTLFKLIKAQAEYVNKTDEVSSKVIELNQEVKNNRKELSSLRLGTKLTATEFDNFSNKVKSTFGTSQEMFSEFIKLLLNDTNFFRTSLLQILQPEDIIKLIKNVSSGIGDLTFETEKELENFIGFLEVLQIELGNTAGIGEEGFSIFSDVIEELNKRLKNLKNINKEVQDDNLSFLDKLTAAANIVLEVYSEISNRLASISQRNNAILLEQLQQAEEQSLAVIGDRSEREREEQLKVQREFAKKRFDIEKKARIQELQFTLANSLASSAQAVIQALGLAAPPPVPQLYAAAIAGLTGIELLTIRDQIRTAQSAVFVGRRGGMIQGGSHEEGGVPALLEGGEFVMSRPAVDRFGDIVGQLNQSVGGRGLQIDDSRIVQAISSQNSTKAPIKTYVLYNDIQNTDKLNKRIEKLSRL